MRNICLILIGLVLSFAMQAYLVSGIEYYFDFDPGPGNGVPIYNSTARVDIEELIDSSALEPGIHRLYVRAQDDSGIWGMPQSSVFVIPYTNNELIETNLAELEYWFDNDPGPGNAISLDFRNSISIDPSINARTMRPGIHRLYVRCKNDDGTWSLPQSKRFFVPYMMAGFVPRDPVAIEYFFDEDPGQGEAIPIYGRSMIMLDNLIDASLLPPGIHRLYVRAQDSRGKWSLPQGLSFVVQSLATPRATITQAEYFFDTDPGFGYAYPLPISPGSSIDLSFIADASELDNGGHRLYIRAQNSEGGWGLPVCCGFDKGVPQGLHLSIIDGSLILSWDSVADALSYNVYSSTSPEGPFLEDTQGIMGADSWSSQVIDSSRFYYIKAVFED